MARQHPFVVGASLAPADFRRLGYSWMLAPDALDRAIVRAYTENVGHPPVERFPRGTEAGEQWYWPNAKRRKHDRRTLAEVARLTSCKAG